MFVHLSVQWDNGQIGGSVHFSYVPASNCGSPEIITSVTWGTSSFVCVGTSSDPQLRERKGSRETKAYASPELEQKWQLATLHAQSSRCRSLVWEALMWCSDLMEQSCSASQRLRSDDLPACFQLSEGPFSRSSLKCIFKGWKISGYKLQQSNFLLD